MNLKDKTQSNLTENKNVKKTKIFMYYIYGVKRRNIIVGIHTHSFALTEHRI